MTTCPTCGRDDLTVDHRVANERAARLLLAELRDLRYRAFPAGVAQLDEPAAVDGLWHLLEALDRRIVQLTRALVTEPTRVRDLREEP